MLFNYRKLSTAIVSACKSEKKTSQTIVLNTITKFFGFRSIQAAEDALSKKTEDCNTTSLSAKLDKLKEALRLVEAGDTNHQFDASQFYTENDKLNPALTGASDFSDKAKPVAEIFLAAVDKHENGDLSAIDIEHGYWRNNVNGHNVFRTLMNFNHNGNSLQVIVSTTESNGYAGWEYETEFELVKLNDKELDASIMNEFGMDEFFEQLSNGSGEVWVPEKINSEKLKEAKALVEQNQFALALLQ